jgi:hypothetical protein
LNEKSALAGQRSQRSNNHLENVGDGRAPGQIPTIFGQPRTRCRRAADVLEEDVSVIGIATHCHKNHRIFFDREYRR